MVWAFPAFLPPALHLPVCTRYAMLTSSTGKKAAVAPYSGHMLAIVARSAMDSWATPDPKNSTNLPTTPTCRRCYTGETIGKFETRQHVFKTQNYFCAMPLQSNKRHLGLDPRMAKGHHRGAGDTVVRALYLCYLSFEKATVVWPSGELGRRVGLY